MHNAAIFTDLHLHKHKDSVYRLQDGLQVLDWVFQSAYEYDCKHIIFLGDLLHDRTRIDVLIYLRTFEMFMKYMLSGEQPFDFWLLLGNHCLYHKEKWDVNSVKPLSSIPNVHIIDKPSTINIGGLDIDFCPYTENPLKELRQLEKTGAKKLLLGHLAVHGAQLNKLYGTRSDVIVEYDNDMVPVSVDIFSPWRQVFLGHYHAAQNLNDKVEYIGSPLQLSFGEAFQEKHLVILDLESQEKTYVKNTFSPLHYIIGPDEIDSYDLNNNFVRIVGDLTAKDIFDLKKRVKEKYNVASLDFKQKNNTNKDSNVVAEVKAMLVDEGEILSSYVKKKGVGILNEKHLMEVVEKICCI